MSCCLIIEIIGLSFNLIGAIVLAVPIANFKKSFDLDEDRIIEFSKGDGKLIYTTEKDKRNSKWALLGIVLMIFGFALQLFPSLLK